MRVSVADMPFIIVKFVDGTVVKLANKGGIAG
jgi:hypothetical protein